MTIRVNKSPIKPRPNGNPPPQKPSALLNLANAAVVQEQAEFERAVCEVMALTGLPDMEVRQRLVSFCARSLAPWQDSYLWLRAKLMRGVPVEW